MAFGDAAHDRQAQAAAGFVAAGAAVEAVEDAFALFGRDARAGVVDLQQRRGRLPAAHAQLDPRARRRIAQRVVGQVAHQQRQRRAIAVHGDRRVGHQLDAAAALRAPAACTSASASRTSSPRSSGCRARRPRRRVRCAPAPAAARRAARRARCLPPALAWPRCAWRSSRARRSSCSCSFSAVSGERSSCAASATKARWVSSDAPSRCQQRVERVHQRRHLVGQPGGGQRLRATVRRARAPRRPRGAAAAAPAPRASQPARSHQRRGQQQRQHAAPGGVGGQLAAHLARLRDLDHAARRGHAEGAPGLAADGDVGKAEHRARRQRAVRPRGVDRAAVDGPDLDHEVELLVGQRAGLGRRDLALVAQRQRHLPQLVVEQRLGLGEHVAVGQAAHHQRGQCQQREQRHQQPDADRVHAGAARRVADAVAQPAHVADEVGAELAPQLVDVDRDRVALDLLAPAVEAVFDLRARQHRARALHQRLEHREFARRQEQRRAVQRDLARRRVEAHAAVLQRRSARARCGGAARRACARSARPGRRA